MIPTFMAQKKNFIHNLKIYIYKVSLMKLGANKQKPNVKNINVTSDIQCPKFKKEIIVQ
jgi:hypothetical protein